MPNLIESGFVHIGGLMPSLQQQIARAQEQISEHRETIANLPTQSFEAGSARMQLLSLLENLAFLRKLSGA